MTHDPFDLVYDFDRDAWGAATVVRVPQGEAPAPLDEPAPGRWTTSPAPTSTLAWLKRRKLPLTAMAMGPAGVAAACLTGSSTALLLLWSIPVGIALWTERPPSRGPTEGDLRLIESPDDPDVCLVQASILHNGVEVGRDRGVAWFEGGRLLFNGHRTSFAIGGEDVLPRSLWTLPTGQFREILRDPLVVPLRVADASAYIQFEVLRHGHDRYLSEHRFISRLAAFRSAPPRSRGPRQWPPFGES